METAMSIAARDLGTLIEQANQSMSQQKATYASLLGFTNGSADASIFKKVVESADVEIFYIDTDIYIDSGILISTTKIRKFVGLGGTITLSNKTTSPTPYIKWEYCNDIIFENVNFAGNFDKALTTDAQYAANVVAPLFLSHCNNIEITSCSFSDIIGAGPVYLMYCDNVVIRNNNVRNCWNHINGDFQGDGIYVGFSSGVRVLDNYIKNGFPDKDKFGRIGITFEFADTKNCIAANNYIYGYDRAVHVELVGGPVLIKNNIIEGCAMAFVGWQNNNNDITFEGNNCSNAGVPANYVAQLLQGTRGFVSLFSNTITVEVNANTMVKNNTFTLAVDVPGIEKFVVSKISGEEYVGNTFNDKIGNKQLFFYNPNDVTINNNRFNFTGNTVKANSIYFGHIGKHRINGNLFDVAKFTYICTPVPSLPYSSREFIGNTLRNGDSGIVTTDGYVFINKVSILCSNNSFRDIGTFTGEQNAIIRANQDYTSTPYLKSVFDTNSLLSTQASTITLLFFGRMDNMIHPTITNKHITSTGVLYEQSGISNKTLILTSPDGTERAITVDNAGALSVVTQRFK